MKLDKQKDIASMVINTDMCTTALDEDRRKRLFKNRILLVIIMLIFLLFTSYNISNYLVNTKYNRISGINNEITDLKRMIANNENITELFFQADRIDKQVQFMNSLCFEVVE